MTSRVLLWLACGSIIAACAAAPDRPLQFVSGEGPVYPAEARAQRIEGWVLVEYDVDSRGRVVAPRVVEADPSGVFEEAALEAVSRWEYRPRLVDGEPQPSTGLQSRVTFRLGDPEEYRDH